MSKNTGGLTNVDLFILEGLGGLLELIIDLLKIKLQK